MTLRTSLCGPSGDVNRCQVLRRFRKDDSEGAIQTWSSLMSAPKKVVLAYSGGLDTSIILK
ncbi:MAG: hypothetical protein KDK09_17170, partial [Rhodobacteraceae bacterium]|nr:hypothetical protein [Paracoccaceae bacterium]